MFAQRFHREANAIAGLQSPHTVYLYDFGTTQDGRLYYVMELLDGISLQTLVDDVRAAAGVARRRHSRQICRSLEEAHRQKIVHRDLKPSNVMICQVAQTCDFVKVLDFGLAKPFGRSRTLSHLTVEGVDAGHARIHGARSRARRARRSTRAPICTRSDASRMYCSPGRWCFPDSNPVDRGAQTYADRAGSAVSADRACRFRPISSASF